VLKNLGILVLAYGALILFVIFVLVPVMIIARVPMRRFLSAVREPWLIAFSTASSEAALPLAMERMEELGVPRRIVAFVLPTGYSFNLDGSTLYLALASVFAAQAAGIDMPLSAQLVMMLTLMLTSKGVAAVPRASLVILAALMASNSRGAILAFSIALLAALAWRRTGGADERGRSGDVGAALAVFDIMAIGFSVQDVGGNWSRQSALPLPRLTRFGFTMNYSDPQETYRLMTTVEEQWPEGAPSRWILGGEAGIVVYGVGLLARAAYQTRTGGTVEPAVTLGGTVALTRLQVDYAYGARDLMGTRAHRLGVRLTL
jgi:hypothetical protein